MTERSLPAPLPGTDLVPDGWCDAVVVPWLAEQTDESHMARAKATLAGLEAAYRTLDADTFEITKAARLLEVRWGELSGPAIKTVRDRIKALAQAEGVSY